MLVSLNIDNYALIKHIELKLDDGFTIITGETGAGKSILLGALGLILGKRADTQVLLDKNHKCIVEGKFNIQPYGLRPFFEENDLDYEDITIVRREIAPSGKSRAFVNDVPAQLSILQQLTGKLIDIHSQHENLHLNRNQFQLQVVDAIANNHDIQQKYKGLFQQYTQLKNKLQKLKSEAEKDASEHDFLQFQLNELKQAKLQDGEMQNLETELNQLEHAGEIKESLVSALNLLYYDDDKAALTNIKQIQNYIREASKHIPEISDFPERLQTVLIELKDISQDLDARAETIHHDPARLEEVNARISLLNQLLKKHGKTEIAELLALQDELSAKVNNIENYDVQLNEWQQELNQLVNKLDNASNALTDSRKKAAETGAEAIYHMLSDLGMPHAVFTIDLQQSDDFGPDGRDEVSFRFSSNKSLPTSDLSKVASGGELSRVMLCIKSLLSGTTGLPTIIFDEIDTGVSGDIADKVGNIIRQMSSSMQVINITHLPQVAGKGNHHFKVYKNDTADGTETLIKRLDSEERVQEIAKMLSGEQITAASLDNARELIG